MDREGERIKLDAGRKNKRNPGEKIKSAAGEKIKSAAGQKSKSIRGRKNKRNPGQKSKSIRGHKSKSIRGQKSKSTKGRRSKANPEKGYMSAPDDEPDEHFTPEKGYMSAPEKGYMSAPEDEPDEHSTPEKTKLPRYETAGNPRGLCLIINNFKFHDYENDRKGSEIDVKELEDLFQYLSFVVTVEKDLTVDEMLRKADEFAKKNHSSVFVCILMSHGGDRDVILDKNGNKLKTEDFMSKFNAANCPSLQNKPKLFFINSCRGSLSEQLAKSHHQADTDGATCFPDSTLPKGSCPLEADFLLAFSTAPGYKSWRMTDTGSIFVSVLVEAIRELHVHHHLLDILTEVNRRLVKVAIEKKAIQIPAPTHTLRKQVWL